MAVSVFVVSAERSLSHPRLRFPSVLHWLNVSFTAGNICNRGGMNHNLPALIVSGALNGSDAVPVVLVAAL